MCFAPQRRALFWHLNFQKCSEPAVFCTLWLGNLLRATTACTFSTSQLPKVVRDCQFLTLYRLRFRHLNFQKSAEHVRTWGALYILTSKCASRQHGVQFFISHLKRCLRTRRLCEPTFRPSKTTNHWKNTMFRDFSTFSRACIFFLLTLSLLWSSLFFSSLLWLFPPLLFHLSILWEVWRLPSIIWYYMPWSEHVMNGYNHVAIAATTGWTFAAGLGWTTGVAAIASSGSLNLVNLAHGSLDLFNHDLLMLAFLLWLLWSFQTQLRPWRSSKSSKSPINAHQSCLFSTTFPGHDGLSKCLFPVLLINRNSMRAASCLPLKNMTYLDDVKTWKFFVTFGNLSKTTGIG